MKNDPVETFRFISRLLSTAGLVFTGLYYAVTQPGPMDVLSGAVIGITMYCVWFARERHANKGSLLEDFLTFNQDDIE